MSKSIHLGNFRNSESELTDFLEQNFQKKMQQRSECFGKHLKKFLERACVHTLRAADDTQMSMDGQTFGQTFKKVFIEGVGRTSGNATGMNIGNATGMKACGTRCADD